MSDEGVTPFRRLSDGELALLSAACEPFRLGRQLGPKVDWPVWDFVARTFARENGPSSDPEEVLAGLPAGASLHKGHAPYRLYWLKEDRVSGVPGEEMTMGLTIAGLHAIRKKHEAFGFLADGLARYIGDLARTGEQLTPASPYEVASWAAPLADFTSHQYMPGHLLPVVLPAAAAAQVLMKESVILSISEREGAWTCDIRGRLLRPFRDVRNAEDYLAIAWRRPVSSSENAFASPLTLIQTIDYLGYVLEASDGWPKSEIEHPVRPRSLNAAASLGLPAATREDFESRLSGACTVIDQFSLPKVPEDVLRKQYGDTDGSVNRLAYYLSQRVSAEPHSSNVADAIAVIRDARNLRVAAQHDAADTRARANKARARFGLPPIAQSWEADWNTVRTRLAGAFSRLIEALQAADRS